MKPIKLLFLFLLLSVSCNTILFASYVKSHPITLKQPDGIVLNLFATGDEFYNWVKDKDGYTVVRNSKGWYVYAKQAGSDIEPSSYIVGQVNPAITGIQPYVNKSSEEIGRIRRIGNQRMTSQGDGRAPHSGTLNNITIFIRFSDQPEFNENISSYNSLFNGMTGNTMQAYFNEASYNQLNVSTSFYPLPNTFVVSWQDSHPRAYYSPYDASLNTIGYEGGANGDERQSREHTLLANAINGVNSAIPSSLNIDGDDDGNVDNVCFIIEGDSDGWNELLWPHRWYLNSQEVFINGKMVYDYNFQLSLFLQDRGVGVLCHEMFHSLGSPDLYHYSYDGNTPVGGWDIMEWDANPPQHMSAYMKFKYGLWIESIPVISTPGTYTLNSLVNPTNNCYRIDTSNSTTEYYVLEYRKQTGVFESSLPGSGLVIYRINMNEEGNAGGPPDEVYAYRVNGTTDNDGDINLANFGFDVGRTIFNQYTNPSPFLSDGINGNIALSNIGNATGNTISFTYTPQSSLPIAVDSFESGFTYLPWTFSGDSNWTITTANHYNGIKSAKSGFISETQSSVMQTSITCNAGQVSFFYKISSEVNNDFLNFYIDDILQNQWSGESNWGMVSFNISAGGHILKWEYIKNESLTDGTDCAWVDYLSYPFIAVGNPPTNLVGTQTAWNEITLNWALPTSTQLPSRSLAGVKIYRGGSLLQTIANPTALQYVDSGLVPGTYVYQVTCYYSNPSGESNFSNESTVIIPAYAFNPPTGFTATPGNESAILTWNAPISGTPTSYKVFRNSNFFVTTLAPTVLNYTYPGLTNNTSYMFWITATYTNPTGESVSTPHIAVRPVAPPLTPPSNLSATIITGNSVHLTWSVQAITGKNSSVNPGDIPDRSLTGFKIYLNNNLYESMTTIAFEYDITNLPNGLSTIGVTAVYTEGESQPALITITGNHDPTMPMITALNGNYPNPFNPSTEISYSVTKPGHVSLDIYNALGQKVRTLVNTYTDAGNHTVTWNGTDDKSNALGSGLYFYKMQSGSYSCTRKMILMK